MSLASAPAGIQLYEHVQPLEGWNIQSRVASHVPTKPLTGEDELHSEGKVKASKVRTAKAVCSELAEAGHPATVCLAEACRQSQEWGTGVAAGVLGGRP